MVPLSTPSLNGNESAYLRECIETGWVADGRFITRFEESLANLLRAECVVACSNGTAALHVALILAGVGPGDHVVCPTVTFIAPANAIRYVGAKPIFIDCDDYLNLDVRKLESFVTGECRYSDGTLTNTRTGRPIKAVIPVHVFGNPVDMDPLIETASRFGLKVIEDATESLGSLYKGRPAGALGDFGCLSFNGNKIITTGGGGALATQSRSHAERCRYLINQAKDDGVRYIHDEVGYNYRLSNIQAALGVAQMERLQQFIETKRDNFAFYRRELEPHGLRFVDEPPNARSNRWFYGLRLKHPGQRDALLERLAREGIQARPLWTPVHLQKPYRSFQAHDISRAVAFWETIICLPCSVDLGQDDIRRVCRVVIDAT